MNKRICAAVMVVAALTTACGGEPAAAPPTTTTTTTTVPPTPAELDQRAKAAIAPPGAFDALGGKFKQSTPANDSDPGAEGEIVASVSVCNDSPVRVDGVSVARTRVWAGQLDLFQRVHAMSDRPAATLVELVRARVKSCAGYRPADQIKVTIPLTKPQGVDDFYAYCETNQDPDLVDWSCHAVMGRGTLITLVVAFGLTQAAAEAQLTSVVPIFAETFAKA